jgi:hypothetical protein
MCSAQDATEDIRMDICFNAKNAGARLPAIEAEQSSE